jgi:hypothetical protein
MDWVHLSCKHCTARTRDESHTIEYEKGKKIVYPTTRVKNLSMG